LELELGLRELGGAFPIQEHVATARVEFLRSTRGECQMLVKSIVAATAIVFATSAFAQGVSSKSPGHQMQKSTKSTAPGASEYAPGQKMKSAKKSTMQKSAKKSSAPGASQYAPGQTTGSATKKSY
jgi:hypothetical protein